jgi:glutaryl-CoA dehydrogenase
MVTRAIEVSGGHALSGAKTWISNSPIADVFVAWAEDDAGAIRSFVLDKGSRGLTAHASTCWTASSLAANHLIHRSWPTC